MSERQLDLFKSKRQKGTLLPRASERALQCAVAHTLRLWCHPMWRYTHMPMGEKRDMPTAMLLKRMGTTAGWPDFLFCGPRGAIVWLELKRPGGGHMSVEQESLALHLTTVCGHVYICTNDYDMALDQLRDHGIVRATVSV